MDQPCRPLIEVLAEMPDPRQARSKHYPLTAVLALACVAMLCGYRSYGAIAEWGRNYGGELLRAVGFARESAPCAATLYLLFRALDRAALEAALGRWPGLSERSGEGPVPMGGGGPGCGTGAGGGHRGAGRRR